MRPSYNAFNARRYGIAQCTSCFTACSITFFEVLKRTEWIKLVYNGCYPHLAVDLHESRFKNTLSVYRRLAIFLPLHCSMHGFCLSTDIATAASWTSDFVYSTWPSLSHIGTTYYVSPPIIRQLVC